MPTKLKRINLSVPRDILLRLERIKSRYGFLSLSAVCIFLIAQQLDFYDPAQ